VAAQQEAVRSPPCARGLEREDAPGLFPLHDKHAVGEPPCAATSHRRVTRGGRLWEHAFQGRPRVNPTVKRGKHGKRREPTCYEDTRPVAGADTGNRTHLYDMHRLEACLHLASYQLTMEHDLNCVRLMRSSAPFLARARPTASALEASSRSIRAACGQHAHLIRRGGECSWAGLRTNPIPPPRRREGSPSRWRR